MNRPSIFTAIDAERDRQEAKWGGRHAWGRGSCASPTLDSTVKLMVLTEECGEVARAVMDGDRDGLRVELVQVAAVACAWLESFDKQSEQT